MLLFSHPYLNFSESSYEQGCLVVGSSQKEFCALTDLSITKIQVPAFLNGVRVVELGKGSFYNTNITKIFIPSTILFLNEQCFFGCSKLTEVRFERGSHLKKIGAVVFQKCTKLEKLDIPANVSEILSTPQNGFRQFGNTDSLTCISYLGSANLALGLFFFSVHPNFCLFVSNLYPSDKFGNANVTNNYGYTCGTSNEPLISVKVKANKCSFVIMRCSRDFVHCMISIVVS